LELSRRNEPPRRGGEKKKTKKKKKKKEKGGKAVRHLHTLGDELSMGKKGGGV